MPRLPASRQSPRTKASRTSGGRGSGARRRIVAVAGSAAVVAGAVVALLGPLSPDSERATAERFVAAWGEEDWEAMHAELTPEVRERVDAETFRRTYRSAARIATVASIRLGEVQDAGRGAWRSTATVSTRAFGSFEADVTIPVGEDGIEWSRHLALPGLGPGESPERETEAPPRASILARGGTPIAEGPAESRSSPLGQAAAAIAGTVSDVGEEGARELEARGFPPGTPVGVNGLEAAFEGTVAGIPGGSLSAARNDDRRVLARSEPQPGDDVETTIDPEVQQASVAALGGRLGGVAILDARSGEVLGLAGLAFSAPQPPGSTFKIVTAIAALEDGLVEPETSFPVETTITVAGREIRNAYEKPCGGTFVESFAESCNTVFAPLGAELGGERIREASERLGFNRPPDLFDVRGTRAVDPPASSVPEDITDELDAAVTGIGQGRVLATPLQMASVAQAVAADGMLAPTPVAAEPRLRPRAEPRRAMARRVARRLRSMMAETVESGTGDQAAIQNVRVAGKTGTAELGTTQPVEEPEDADPDVPPPEPEQELNAWFAGFAPVREPRVAAAVMVVQADGDGGAVAAPIFRDAVAAALRATR